MLDQMKLKLFPTMELITVVNELLSELNKRKQYIIDWENPDMYLNHLEYHSASGILPGGDIDPARGDGSDNVYCFLVRWRKMQERIDEILNLIDGQLSIVADNPIEESYKVRTLASYVQALNGLLVAQKSYKEEQK